MLLTIIAALFLIALLIPLIKYFKEHSDHRQYKEDKTGELSYVSKPSLGLFWTTFGVGLTISLFALLVIGSTMQEVRDKEAGWSTVNQMNYDISNGSKIDYTPNAKGGSLTFVTNVDGATQSIEVNNISGGFEVLTSGEPNVLQINEQHRELGTDIYPWGEGYSRTVAVLK